ncbi:transposase [Paenibacillus illinoisensis]|uniref:transposase n=1 Tax=Paenibacillus illinoisensis TaxID=59845 RepID=UPI0015E8A136|nr:transposase [Paenibacillus illinoisensis]
MVETEIEPLPRSENKIGVDLGLKDFAIPSTGDLITYFKHLRRSEKRLARLQRELSRKQKGSRNRDKARLKVARHHEKNGKPEKGLFTQRVDPDDSR